MYNLPITYEFEEHGNNLHTSSVLKLINTHHYNPFKVNEILLYLVLIVLSLHRMYLSSSFSLYLFSPKLPYQCFMFNLKENVEEVLKFEKKSQNVKLKFSRNYYLQNHAYVIGSLKNVTHRKRIAWFVSSLLIKHSK